MNAIERSRMRIYMEDRVERFTKSMGSEEAGKTGAITSLMKFVCRGKQKHRVIATGRRREARWNFLKMGDSKACSLAEMAQQMDRHSDSERVTGGEKS